MRFNAPIAIAAFALSWLGNAGPSAPLGRPATARGDAPGAGAEVARNPDHGAVQLDVADVERKVLAARRAITSGEFEVTEAYDARGRKNEYRFHTWVSGDGRIRQERPMPDGLQVVIRNPDAVYFYTVAPGRLDNPDRTKRHAIETWPIKDAPADQFPYAACDPRVLMQVPVSYGLTYAHTLDSRVGGADRENLRVREGVWKGGRVLTVSFTVPRTGNDYEYDVSPERGYSIVRWRLRYQKKGPADRKEPFEFVMTCKPAEVAPGVWFPEIVESTTTRPGKPDSRETVSVKVVSVNRPIDDKTFTLAGAELPAGVLIASTPPAPDRHDKNKEPAKLPPLMIWDGKKVREFTAQDHAEIKASHEAAGKQGPETKPAAAGA